MKPIKTTTTYWYGGYELYKTWCSELTDIWYPASVNPNEEPSSTALDQYTYIVTMAKCSVNSTLTQVAAEGGIKVPEWDTCFFDEWIAYGNIMRFLGWGLGSIKTNGIRPSKTAYLNMMCEVIMKYLGVYRSCYTKYQPLLVYYAKMLEDFGNGLKFSRTETRNKDNTYSHAIEGEKAGSNLPQMASLDDGQAFIGSVTQNMSRTDDTTNENTSVYIEREMHRQTYTQQAVWLMKKFPNLYAQFVEEFAKIHVYVCDPNDFALSVLESVGDLEL